MIWVDVTDIAHRITQQPTAPGIQRVVLELLKILHKHPEVRVCVFNPAISAYAQIPFDDLVRPPPPPPITARVVRRAKKTATSLLPKSIRRLNSAPRSPFSNAPAAAFHEGDILASLGMFWFAPEHCARLIRTRFVHRMKLAVLIYDLILAHRPEWFGADFSNRWSEQAEQLLRQADFAFTISRFVASQIDAFTRERCIPSPPIAVLELGDTNFNGRRDGPRVARLAEPYVLTIGTIDIRKNQIALLPVWSRLLRELGERRTPKLVVIGDNGARGSEFWLALEQTPNLRDKVVVVTRADDNLLSSYYEGALFTIFPTLSEGWGFPVAESLMFGKACVASNVDSLREVGGDLVCYVDPHDLEEIYDRVRILIVNDDERARWEDRIRSEYRRRTWEATASSFLQHLAGEPPARAENDVSSRGSRE